MKQEITLSQLSQLKPIGREKLRKYILKKNNGIEFVLSPIGVTCYSDGKEMAWMCGHGGSCYVCPSCLEDMRAKIINQKFYILNIGQMIELLGKKLIISYVKSKRKWNVCLKGKLTPVIDLETGFVTDNDSIHFYKEELCDALWEAVKYDLDVL